MGIILDPEFLKEIQNLEDVKVRSGSSVPSLFLGSDFFTSLSIILQKLASDPRCKGMPLSSFLLKPMQRITRYPLLIRSVSVQWGEAGSFKADGQGASKHASRLPHGLTPCLMHQAPSVCVCVRARACVRVHVRVPAQQGIPGHGHYEVRDQWQKRSARSCLLPLGVEKSGRPG